MIQKEIKNGSISRKKGVNAYILIINNYDGLILLSSLNLNFEEINLSKKPLNYSPLDSNA
jgi:hypothetical protein